MELVSTILATLLISLAKGTSFLCSEGANEEGLRIHTLFQVLRY